VRVIFGFEKRIVLCFTYCCIACGTLQSSYKVGWEPIGVQGKLGERAWIGWPLSRACIYLSLELDMLSTSILFPGCDVKAKNLRGDLTCDLFTVSALKLMGVLWRQVGHLTLGNEPLQVSG
jgi:hypothetical protein